MTNDVHRSRTLRGISLSLALVWGSLGCGDDADVDHTPKPADTVAPACDFAPTDKHIFTSNMVPLAPILRTLPLGEMSPETFEEAFPNREMGFSFYGFDVEIPVTAPAKMYVQAFEYTHFFGTFPDAFKQNQIDYALTVWFCDEIWGDLAHVTGLSEALVGAFATRLGTTAADLLSREVSVDGVTVVCDLSQINTDENAAIKHACLNSWFRFDDPENERGECTVEFEMRKCIYRFNQDGGEFVVVEGGTPIGLTAGYEGSPFHPGLDFNMMDRRFAWDYLNPARLGDPESLRAQSYLHAACPYEYFADATYRNALLDLVGDTIVTRASESEPCGTLNVDVPHTAAGIWFRADTADDYPEVASIDALNMEEHHVPFHDNVMALARDIWNPEKRSVISTSLTSVAESGGQATLVELEIDLGLNINVPFDQMAPLKVYCLRGHSGLDEFHYYIRFSDAEDPLDAELWLEPRESACPEDFADWAIDEGQAIRFVR